MTHRLRLFIACAGIWVFFVAGLPVQAASFTAGTAAELIQAIDDANTNTEADTITLTADITLDAVNNNADLDNNSETDGPNGLPAITSEIIIEGAGYTIARSSVTGTPAFRIIGVANTGNLTLNDVTLRNGIASDGDSSSSVRADEGGGILNLGTLTITSSTFSGNNAQFIGGGIANETGGTLTMSHSTISGNSANFSGGIYNNGTLTMSDSTISSNTAQFWGGGIYNLEIMTVTNSIISDNSANNGGGINNLDRMTVSNSTISGNTAGNNGGGINNEGTLTVSNSTVSNNTTQQRDGGGINNEGTLTVSNSTISSNTATTEEGGGISNVGTLTMSDSTISRNDAPTGGGIYNFNVGDVTVRNSTISDNSANNGGGINNNSFGGGTVTVSNSTLSGNTAQFWGGGIFNNEGTVTVRNSTLSGNSAGNNGGGVFNSSNGSLTMRNSTIASNNANVIGGGIINYNTVTLSNSIIAQNTNVTGSSDYSAPSGGSVMLEGNNIVEDGSVSSTGVSAVDPNLAPLADNGGPTQTHALLNGSPAIDASGTGATTADQRSALAVGTRDIGAYEFDGVVPTVSFTIDNTTLTEGGPTTLAIIPLTATGFTEMPDVEFVFTGDATDDDYTLIGYPILNASTITYTLGILIVDDAINESTETLTLEMRVVGTGDITGSNPQTITLIDNDGAGVDVNGDGIVSPSDAVYVLNRLGSGDLSADVNGDNTVDMTDLNDVLTNLGN